MRKDSHYGLYSTIAPARDIESEVLSLSQCLLQHLGTAANQPRITTLHITTRSHLMC